MLARCIVNNNKRSRGRCTSTGVYHVGEGCEGGGGVGGCVCRWWWCV